MNDNLLKIKSFTSEQEIKDYQDIIKYLCDRHTIMVTSEEQDIFDFVMDMYVPFDHLIEDLQLVKCAVYKNDSGDFSCAIPLELNEIDVDNLDDVNFKINQLLDKWTYASKDIIGCDEPLICDLPFRSTEPIVECDETGLKVYRTSALMMEMYSTPWQNEPDDHYFLNYEAYSCYYGMIYSKDFAYFSCPNCGRDICEQNPANGYHIQYRIVDGEYMCLSCYEKMILADGIEYRDVDGFAGMFLETEDIGNNGWKLHNSYFVNHSNENYVKNKIRSLFKDGTKVLIQYDRLAYGGSEGSISVYTKNDDDIV